MASGWVAGRRKSDRELAGRVVFADGSLRLFLDFSRMLPVNFSAAQGTRLEPPRLLPLLDYLRAGARQRW